LRYARGQSIADSFFEAQCERFQLFAFAKDLGNIV
jgi:hypothetical protein